MILNKKISSKALGRLQKDSKNIMGKMVEIDHWKNTTNIIKKERQRTDQLILD